MRGSFFDLRSVLPRGPMILEYDETLQNLVRELTPHWTEIWADKRDFSITGDASFVTGAVLLVGQPSLLCAMTAKTLSRPRVDYYPIYLKVVDQSAYSPDEWTTLARAGGMSDLEQKVQWLFDKPSLRLLTSEEECADGLEPDAQQYLLRFYGGLEIGDPQGRGSLRITANDLPSFTVTLSFSL
jgi:hypothetical protein